MGFTAMTGIHMLIGLGEGLITALAFLAIARTRGQPGTEGVRGLPLHWLRVDG